MIQSDAKGYPKRVNGEFYIAPVFQQMIDTQPGPEQASLNRWRRKVLPFFVSKMRGLGTPEDLESFLKNG
jgi:hypothetical protein